MPKMIEFFALDKSQDDSASWPKAISGRCSSVDVRPDMGKIILHEVEDVKWVIAGLDPKPYDGWPSDPAEACKMAEMFMLTTSDWRVVLNNSDGS